MNVIPVVFFRNILKSSGSKISNNYIVPIVIVSSIISGCSGPNTKSISNFGKEATKASLVIDDAGALQSEFNIENSILFQHCNYANKSEFVLADKPKNITLDVINERKKYTKALLKYSKALIEADDPEGVRKLNQAATAFSKAVGSTIFVASAAIGAPVPVGSVTNLFINGVVRTTEMRRRREILKIATEIDAVIFSISERIISDQVEINSFLTGRLLDWETSVRSCVLEKTNNKSPESYKLFIEIDNAKRSYLSRINLIKKSPVIYKTITDAHYAMITSPADFDDSIVQIQTTLNEISDLFAALNGI